MLFHSVKVVKDQASRIQTKMRALTIARLICYEDLLAHQEKPDNVTLEQLWKPKPEQAAKVSPELTCYSI